MRAVGRSFNPEIIMSRKQHDEHRTNPAKPFPENALRPNPKTQPAEPIEVLGRHKNAGQKDHKGAR